MERIRKRLKEGDKAFHFGCLLDLDLKLIYFKVIMFYIKEIFNNSGVNLYISFHYDNAQNLYAIINLVVVGLIVEISLLTWQSQSL